MLPVKRVNRVPRSAWQQGSTLTEAALVLAIAAAVLTGATTLGSAWISSVRDLSQGATVTVQKDTLAHAARGWYTSRFCGLQRDSTFVAPPVEIQLEVDDLRGYLPDNRLIRETQHPASRWRIGIAREGLPSPQLRIQWELRAGDASAALARRSGAFCDADGDGTSAEPCPDFALGAERLLWVSLLAAPSQEVSRNRRLMDWQRFNAIDCDADGPDPDGDGTSDGDGQLDAYCDGDGDGLFGPYDADGDGLDDAHLFDADADGILDLDVAGGPDGVGDLAVDVRDWHALGC